MKVLILSNSLSGLISFRKELIEAMITQGWDVVVSSPHCDRAPELTKIGATVVETPINRHGTNPLQDMALIIRYIRLLRREHPDAVLTYTAKPNIYGGMATAICRVPQIANITGLGTVISGGNGAMKRLLMTLYRFGLRKARTVFFQNAENMEALLSAGTVNRDIAQLIPGSGVNTSRFAYSDYPSESPNPIFLYIGRVMEAKGSRELFEAARAVRKEYSGAEFHIIGSVEREFKSEFDSLMKDGNVIFHGEQDDVRSFIALCHCLVHPSYHEGMSNVILEVSAMGRPVITTNVSGCKDAVTDGITGLLVNPKDSAILTRRILEFIRLPYRQKILMGRAARDKVVAEFDRTLVIRAYLSALTPYNPD